MAGPEHDMYDIVIIGGGATGLSAGLYAARSKHRVLLVEQGLMGGQISITSEIVNYPGVYRTSGIELIETMERQAREFGTEFLNAYVTGIELTDDDAIRIVKTDQGDVKTHTVLVATGANPRTAGFEGENEFRGRGISYCATCDGGFFKDKPVYVVGGGFAAAEEALYLTRFASKVTMIIRRDRFSCAEGVYRPTIDNDKVEVLYNTNIVSVDGKYAMERMVLRNNKTGEETIIEADSPGDFGVFVFTGYTPESGLLEGLADIGEDGGVITDTEMNTKTVGVYAAGDVRGKNLRQLVTAAADGAIAATTISRYLTDLFNERPELADRDPSCPIEQ